MSCNMARSEWETAMFRLEECSSDLKSINTRLTKYLDSIVPPSGVMDANTKRAALGPQGDLSAEDINRIRSHYPDLQADIERQGAGLGNTELATVPCAHCFVELCWPAPSTKCDHGWLCQSCAPCDECNEKEEGP